MCKGSLKVLNAPNAKKKLSKDAQNAKVCGIALGIAKFQTGLLTKQNAAREQNNYNKYRKKAKKQQQRRASQT
jgi:choline kinase